MLPLDPVDEEPVDKVGVERSLELLRTDRSELLDNVFDLVDSTLPERVANLNGIK